MKKLIALLLCVVCLAQSAYAASPAESARDLALSAASGQKSLAGVSGELLAQGEDFPAGTSVCDWTAIAFALLGAEDAVISDELNHASIIDGVRLCKAHRYRYKNSDMDDLRAQLVSAREAGCKKIVIATDGVFSMDGYIANLKGICDLADEFDALVMVDDSHAVGFMGEHGRGTPEYCGVMGRVDILTGTFGKAMGGASGGYTAAKREIVDLLRQRSRPYLFSNSLAPAICAATIATIDMLTESTALRDKVHENARYFRAEMEKLGFDLLPGEHPIVPVMLYDPKVANEFARRMLEKGVYVVGSLRPLPAREPRSSRWRASSSPP